MNWRWNRFLYAWALWFVIVLVLESLDAAVGIMLEWSYWVCLLIYVNWAMKWCTEPKNSKEKSE